MLEGIELIYDYFEIPISKIRYTLSYDQINDWLEMLNSVSLDYPEDHEINTIIDELDQMSK